MNRITQVRVDMVNLLKANGFAHVHHYIGEVATPPYVMVVPAPTGYVEPAETFGNKYDVRIMVIVVSSKGTNLAAAEEVDQMVADVIDAVDTTDDWYITDVAQPGYITLNGSRFLGTGISIEQRTAN